jgi:amidase
MNREITEITIAEIIRGQRDGEFSAAELLAGYVERIRRLDKSGPALNAVLELNPHAESIAAGRDAARGRGEPLGPLHGVPVLLKDNIDTGDTMHTSAGSLALEHSYAPSDAFLVGRLRDAGAVILGKANMTEWANFMSEQMPNGYSSRGGQVLNPYGAELDPGGSSTGSAVATAANLCAVAIGTETSGSILSPAINNVLVGIKPTVGLVSRTGIVPISHSQDTAGPLARCVEDAAVVLSVIRGADAHDPATATSVGHQHADYRAAMNGEMAGLRIGVPRESFWNRLSEAGSAATEQVLDTIRELGATVVDPTDLPSAGFEWSITVLMHEFKSGLNAYLARLGPGAAVRTLADVVDFNRQHSRRALRYGQTVLTRSERLTSGTLTEPDYLEARFRDIRLSREQGIDNVLRAHNLDLLVFPSYVGCAVAAMAGYPSIAIPAGLVSDTKGVRPHGVTFTGPAYSEPVLIRAGRALEQRLNGRVRPELGD